LVILLIFFFFFFFFNDTATTEIYTLSLHDALPISIGRSVFHGPGFWDALRRWAGALDFRDFSGSLGEKENRTGIARTLPFQPAQPNRYRKTNLLEAKDPSSNLLGLLRFT